MENSLYGSLVAAGAAALVHSAPGRGRPLAAGALLMALATFARPEAPLVFVLVLAPLAAPRRPVVGVRALSLAAAVFAAPLAAYAAWKLWYFGELLPNTFYAKNIGAVALASPGRHYVAAFLSDHGFGLSAALVLLAPLLAPAGQRRRAGVPLAVTAGYLVYVWAVGGDIYYHYRFLTPVLPFLFIGMTAAARGGVLRLRHVRPRTAGTAAACLLLGLGALGDVRTERRYREVRARDRDLNDFRERVSSWLQAGFPRGTVIASISAGIIPYRTGMRTVDLAGLTHREIGRSRVEEDARTPLAHQKSSAAAVLQERPDLIEFRHYRYPPGLHPGMGEPVFPDFADFYRPFFQNPPRYPAWRDLARRAEFHRSYRLAIFPLGKGSGVATFLRLPAGAISEVEALANYGWALQAEGSGAAGAELLLRAFSMAPGIYEVRRRLEALAEAPPPGVDAARIRAALGAAAAW